MCEPVTLTSLATAAVSAGGAAAAGLTVGGLTVAGTAALAGMAAFSATSAGLSARNEAAVAKNQANYQAAVARNNATMAEYARQDAVRQGGAQAVKAHREAERLRGAQVVHMAANGLDLNSGTPAAILDDTDYFGAVDAQNIRNNAARAAWGHQVEASNYTASGLMYDTAARNYNPRDAAVAGATGSLLASAGQFAGAYF